MQKEQETANTEIIFGLIKKELTLADFMPYKLDTLLNSTDATDLRKYNEKTFKIIRGLTCSEIDISSAPMFLIEFEDGHQERAFMDEIFESRLFDELVTDEDIVR